MGGTTPRGAPPTAAEPDEPALRRAFVDVLSHELRTPITSIYGGARLLLDDGLAPDTRASLLADIAAEAGQLAHLVEDVLAIARLEYGLTDRGTEPVLVQRLAESVAAAERRRWPGRSVTVRGVPGLPPARGDTGLVAQVLRNLIASALKYSPAHEDVRVTLGSDARAVHVTVSDRVPGAPAEAGSDAFALFHRHPEVAGHVYGTGMGLYMARLLIEAQGGEVWLRGRPGGGTDVGFTLPIYREEAER